MKRAIKPQHALALAFVVYGLILGTVVALMVPPFMGADEMNHFKRANLIACGSLFGKRVVVNNETVSGGDSEVSISEAQTYYDSMAFHPNVKLDPANDAKARDIKWGSETAATEFTNTAPYPPIFYLPQALAICIGKLAGLGVVATLLWSRLANALVCLAVGGLALGLANRGRWLMFAVLTLPMSVALYASCTQDGLIITTSVLACALLSRGFGEGRNSTLAEIIGAAICLVLVGMAKPPYVLLSLLLLVASADSKWVKLGLTAAALAVCGLWHGLMLAVVQTPLVRSDAVLNQGAQVSFVLHHPMALLAAVGRTAFHGVRPLGSQVIGVFGWLDTPLPKLFYGLVAFVLLSILLAECPSKTSKLNIWRAAILLTTAVSVFVALYVAYTPVGSALVDGVQGRYFLPLLALLSAALTGNEEIKGWRLRLASYSHWALGALLPLSIVVVVLTLRHRY